MKENDRILKLKEVVDRTRLSSSTLWRLEKEGLFPKRVKIGKRAAGWLESKIDEWFLNKTRKDNE